MTPDDGIDDVAFTGCPGTGGCAAVGAAFDNCFLVAVSGLRAVSADRAECAPFPSVEGRSAGFAGFPADLSAESAL